MEKENLLELSKTLTPRGLGVKISKNPALKEKLYELTSFLPEDAPQSLRIWCLKNEILSKDKLPKCPVCGKLPAYSTGKFLTYCSKKCAQLDKEKFLKKYGVEHHLKSDLVKEKRRRTVLEKYGVENVGVVTREKAKKTMIEKYGVDNYTKTQEYKKKLRKTSLEKYGVVHPAKSAIVREKIKKVHKEKKEEIKKAIERAFLEKYGVRSPMHIQAVKNKVLEKYKKKVWERLILKFEKQQLKPLFSFEEFRNIKVKERERLKFLCTVCNTEFYDHLDNGHIPVCPNCTKNQTKPEQLLISFLKEKAVQFETGNRTEISPFEIDIFIPEKRIGVEINGIYYHTVENLRRLRGLSEREAKNYHRLKWILSTQNNIRLIQFWDSEVIRKKDIVFSIVASAIGINQKVYARDCYIEEITEEDAYRFFLQNHINDEPVLGKNFALKKNEEILQAISVGKARFGLNGYEIYRIATKNGFNVVGGTQRLIKYVIQNIGITKLYSYVNLRLFTGKSLEKIGFKRIKITEPDFYYTKDFINLIPRERFMRSKTGISEKEFVEKEGYKKIYGVGHALYMLEI